MCLVFFESPVCGEKSGNLRYLHYNLYVLHLYCITNIMCIYYLDICRLCFAQLLVYSNYTSQLLHVKCTTYRVNVV